jgi:predicted kinase
VWTAAGGGAAVDRRPLFGTQADGGSPRRAIVAEECMSELGRGRLLFMCGKMAAGKSTLSRALAAREHAVLLEQDALLEGLYPGAFVDFAAFLTHSARLQATLAPHIVSLLLLGVTVVLDFPANTRKSRAWFRELFERAGADHELHFIAASDELCRRQLRQRSRDLNLAPGAKWTTDADFDEVTAYFEPPADDEGFLVVRHERD